MTQDPKESAVWSTSRSSSRIETPPVHWRLDWAALNPHLRCRSGAIFLRREKIVPERHRGQSWKPRIEPPMKPGSLNPGRGPRRRPDRRLFGSYVIAAHHRRLMWPVRVVDPGARPGRSVRSCGSGASMECWSVIFCWGVDPYLPTCSFTRPRWGSPPRGRVG